MFQFKVSRINYSIDKTNCNTNKSNFWITRLKIITHLAFLTHFLSKILGHNLEYTWGNVKIVTCDNYWLIYFYLPSYYFKNF